MSRGRKPSFARGDTHRPDKVCRTCKATFYTSVGLAEHVRIGCGNSHVRPLRIRRTLPTPAQVAARLDTGRRVAALNNSRRRCCGDCGLVSTPAGIGAHQKFTGHNGWTDAA